MLVPTDIKVKRSYLTYIWNCMAVSISKYLFDLERLPLYEDLKYLHGNYSTFHHTKKVVFEQQISWLYQLDLLSL